MPDHVPSAELPPDGPLTLRSGRVVPRERVEQGGDHECHWGSNWSERWILKDGELDQEQSIDEGATWHRYQLQCGSDIAYTGMWSEMAWPSSDRHMPPSLEPRRVWKEITHDGHTFLGWDWESTADRIENEDVRFSVEIHPRHIRPWSVSNLEAMARTTDEEIARCDALRTAFGLPTVAESRAMRAREIADRLDDLPGGRVALSVGDEFPASWPREAARRANQFWYDEGGELLVDRALAAGQSTADLHERVFSELIQESQRAPIQVQDAYDFVGVVPPGESLVFSPFMQVRDDGDTESGWITGPGPSSAEDVAEDFLESVDRFREMESRLNDESPAEEIYAAIRERHRLHAIAVEEADRRGILWRPGSDEVAASIAEQARNRK